MCWNVGQAPEEWRGVGTGTAPFLFLVLVLFVFLFFFIFLINCTCSVVRSPQVWVVDPSTCCRPAAWGRSSPGLLLRPARNSLAPPVLRVTPPASYLLNLLVFLSPRRFQRHFTAVHRSASSATCWEVFDNGHSVPAASTAFTCALDQQKKRGTKQPWAHKS